MDSTSKSDLVQRFAAMEDDGPSQGREEAISAAFSPVRDAGIAGFADDAGSRTDFSGAFRAVHSSMHNILPSDSDASSLRQSGDVPQQRADSFNEFYQFEEGTPSRRGQDPMARQGASGGSSAAPWGGMGEPADTDSTRAVTPKSARDMLSAYGVVTDAPSMPRAHGIGGVSSTSEASDAASTRALGADSARSMLQNFASGPSGGSALGRPTATGGASSATDTASTRALGADSARSMLQNFASGPSIVSTPSRPSPTTESSSTGGVSSATDAAATRALGAGSARSMLQNFASGASVGSASHGPSAATRPSQAIAGSSSVTETSSATNAAATRALGADSARSMLQGFDLGSSSTGRNAMPGNPPKVAAVPRPPGMPRPPKSQSAGGLRRPIAPSGAVSTQSSKGPSPQGDRGATAAHSSPPAEVDADSTKAMDKRAADNLLKGFLGDE